LPPLLSLKFGDPISFSSDAVFPWRDGDFASADCFQTGHSGRGGAY
jgi:hypothetical protein